METETTTIEIKKDVYARLVEEKEHTKEPFNLVLRRLLEMDDDTPKGRTANHFTATLVTDRFQNDLSVNQPFVKALDLDEDEKMDLVAGNLNTQKKIDGVEISIKMKTSLELEIETNTDLKLRECLEKLKPLVEPVFGEYGSGSVHLAAWYCYSMREEAADKADFYQTRGHLPHDTAVRLSLPQEE